MSERRTTPDRYTVVTHDCGFHLVAGHPIQHCYSCEREAFDAEFAKLRAQRTQSHLLGYDHYTDCLYVWAGGVVVGIEGQLDRFIRHQQADKLVNELTKLQAENKDLLAENARLRRRLEGK